MNHQIETVAEIERHLRQLRVPDEVVENHIKRLCALRGISRRRPMNRSKGTVRRRRRMDH
jgi:hypothetical protein